MNVDDGVVLAVIQITDDRVPNGRHLRVQHTYGWERRLLLDPARGKERLMEIQQHDGVVVDVAGLRQGFAELLRERERGVAGEEGGAQGCVCCPPSPPLFIGPLGGASPWEIRSPRGAAAKGGKGCLAPQGKGEAPPPRVPNPRHMGGGPRGAPQPTNSWFPSTFSPRGPPG